MKKKALLMLVALLLTLGMVVLTSCGSNDDDPPAQDAVEATPAPPPEVDDEPEVEELPEDWVPETGENLVLPLTTEPVLFTVWGAEGGSFDSGLERLSDSDFYQELMRRTGVTIEWMHPPTGGEQENLNLLIAAGDLPDVLNIMGTGGGAGMLQGGMSTAIAEGYILDVTELVHRYAPYYWELIHADDLRRRWAFTDEGMLPGFWQVNTPVQPPWYGLITRGDWLDELGISMPITFDDWEEALLRMKNELGATAPFLLGPNGFAGFFQSFNQGFGTVPGFYQVDGEVRFGPMGENFREYVEMLSRWYSLGIIDPDFMSAPAWATPDHMTTTGIAGLFHHMHVMIPVLGMISPDPDFRAVPVPPPVRTPGQAVHLGQLNPLTEWIMLITDQNPDPVLWTRLMNYLYSPEGTILANWGVYGVHHEINPDDGLPQFNAFMYDNPDGWTLHNVQRRYTRMPSGGWAYNHQREDRVPGDGPILIEAAAVWATNTDFAWQMPPVTLTAAEGAENSRIMTDVNTYRDEMVARFITGIEPMENWDNFINTLRGMDIERSIAIHQDALDRFNAR